MNLFELAAKITLDATNYENGMKNAVSNAQSGASSISKSLSNGIKTAGKWTAGIVGGATAIATALVGTAKSSAESIDTIDKASQRMNVSAESYQELAYAAGLCGVEMSTIERAAKSLDEGVDFTSALSEILSIEDASERASMASEVFGDTVAYQLTPLLNAGADGFADMTAEANELGLVMSQDAVTAGAELNDAFSKVEQSASSLKNGLFSALMPVVKELLDMVIQAMPTIRSMIDKLAPILAGFLQKTIDGLTPIVEAIFPAMISLFDSLMPVFSEVLDAVLPVLIELVNTLLPPLMQIIDAILPPAISLIQAVLKILQPITTLLNPIITLVMNLLKPLLDLVEIILPPLINIIAELESKWLTMITDAINMVLSALNGMYSSFNEAGKNIINGFLSGLKNAWNTVTGWVTGAVDWFKNAFGAVGEWFSGLFGGGSNTSTVSTSTVKYNNNGDVIGAINGLNSTLSNQVIVLSDGTLVGALTDKYDVALGTNYSANKRGAIG